MSALVIPEEIEYEGLSNAGTAINMFAGGLAGISEHAVMFPVDSIKTRIQVISASSTTAYSGITQAFSQISATEGTRRLWRGVGSVIIGSGPAHAIYFGVYEVAKEFLGGNRSGQQMLANAGAGAMATIASDALMNPFDVVKQRMQIYGSNFQSVPEAAKTIFRTEGIRAFYISYPTTLMMTVPFTAVQFSVYEELKRLINPANKYSPATHVFCGGIAGGIAAAVTTPLDVCKTLLQTKGASDNVQIRNSTGIIDACKIIYHSNGLKGFGRGMLPRVLTFMPSNALCWLSYEFFKVFLRGSEG